MFLLSDLSAESKKEINSLRSLRLSGDYKLCNYNTIPYLRIRVLHDIDFLNRNMDGIVKSQNLQHYSN